MTSKRTTTLVNMAKRIKEKDPSITYLPMRRNLIDEFNNSDDQANTKKNLCTIEPSITKSNKNIQTWLNQCSSYNLNQNNVVMLNGENYEIVIQEHEVNDDVNLLLSTPVHVQSDSYYKCAKSNNVCCPGTAKKNVDGSIVEIKPHLPTHIRSLTHNGNLLKLFKTALKLRAKNENLSLKTIYDEESRRHTVAAASYPWSTAESTMRFARRSSLPTLPQSLQGLATRFEDGYLNRFSCCDTIIYQGCITDTDGNQSVIFACRQLIDNVLTNDISEIHADATFKVVPVNMGKQLLTIHCMIENYSIPIVYALMESKTRNSYQCIINFMKTYLFPELKPQIIITDYESALRDTLLTLGTEETRART